MAELHSGADHFFIFVAALFVSLAIAESFMLLMAALVPHYIIGIALAAGLYGGFMLVQGFLGALATLSHYFLLCSTLTLVVLVLWTSSQVRHPRLFDLDALPVLSLVLVRGEPCACARARARSASALSLSPAVACAGSAFSFSTSLMA